MTKMLQSAKPGLITSEMIQSYTTPNFTLSPPRAPPPIPPPPHRYLSSLFRKNTVRNVDIEFTAGSPMHNPMYMTPDLTANNSASKKLGKTFNDLV